MKKITADLSLLKEDYRSYSSAFKDTLCDDVKKNTKIGFEEYQTVFSSDDIRNNFSVINRDFDYLRALSLPFAKQYNVENDVKKIFDSNSWNQVSPIKKFPSKRRRSPSVVSAIPKSLRSVSKSNRMKYADFMCAWPLEKNKFWFSSPFGLRKIGKGAYKFHYGIDLAALQGTIVKSVEKGIVVQSSYLKGYGNCITIAHNYKYKTKYAHLHFRKAQVGQRVKKGDIIGTVGSTGFVKTVGKDASHLHFEVYAFGKRINPVFVLI